MANLNHIGLGFLILQIYVHAAPNDVSKLEEIAKVEHADHIVEQPDSVVEQTDSIVEQTGPKLDSEPKEVESDDNSAETQRHKRYYNSYDFSYNPFTNSGYNKRDEGPNTSYYPENPLLEVYRRVQDISQFTRQPQQPPAPFHFPIYYPVLFIPPPDCNCNNENQNPTTPEPEPENPVTPNSNDGDSTVTTVNVTNRWPVMEDERQNWGIIVNETETDLEEGVDFNRPISFDPIKLNKPIRPPPPVEHGTVQSDSSSQNQPRGEAPNSQTTTRPFQSRPQSTQPASNGPTSGVPPPSPCDAATISCCHQPQVTYECFVAQGCRDLKDFSNPCDANQILRVIERITAFYKQTEPKNQLW